MNTIVFQNQPKLSLHTVDTEADTRRLALVPHIEDFLSNHKRFSGKEVSVTFASQGVSSLVAILTTTSEKVVLKVPLRIDRSYSEPLFLKTWEKAGVKVPHVFEEGSIGDHPYSLMEYINAPILRSALDTKEHLEKQKYAEMGQVLRHMHEPKATGYGRIVDGKAEHLTFRGWIEGQDIGSRIAYVQEHKLLDAQHGDLDKAIDILEKYISKKGYNSYCHWDFCLDNIFATEPITIFDPDCVLTDPYIELGRTLVIMVALRHGEMEDAGGQLLEGYFGSEAYDKEVLRAAMLLNAYTKFEYWHKKGKRERMEAVKGLLTSVKV